MPREEYDKRLNELLSFSSYLGANLIVETPDFKDWADATHPYKDLGEKSERCWVCYEYRLEKTFSKAKALGYDIVATSLTISPHKIAEKINASGIRLKGKYNIDYLESNFKKNDGFKKSLKISKEMNFYRQSYCGCIYSKLEREASMKEKSRSISA